MEKLVGWYGDRASALVTGIVIGAIGLGAAALAGYLPIDKFGYVTEKDQQTRLEEQRKEYEEHLKDQQQKYESRLRESKEDTLAINPNDSIVISPIKYVRFEWTGPVDVNEYTLTLLGPDNAGNGLRHEEVQIKNARSVLAATTPTAGQTRELKYAGLNIARFGEYFWTIREYNSPRLEQITDAFQFTDPVCKRLSKPKPFIQGLVSFSMKAAQSRRFPLHPATRYLAASN